ncbi:hypothetical protein LCGC14_1989970 [marine sediment metagenome]|uniref:Uncharacterized protein n=1 Tax=marine sediment metagenome TaxID=412755 RepID=A0A0F9FUF6_9ZZZZ
MGNVSLTSKFGLVPVPEVIFACIGYSFMNLPIISKNPSLFYILLKKSLGDYNFEFGIL